LTLDPFLAELSMALNDRSDDELKAMLEAGALGEKRSEVAQAVLRRRQLERLEDWFSRHSWLGALIAAVGVSALLFPKLTKK
jgi:hypothetical protein